MNAAFFASLTAVEIEQVHRDLWDQTAGNLGCMLVGHREAFGNIAGFSADFRRLMQESAARVQSSSIVLDLNQAWSLCLSKIGLTYASPDEIISDLVEKKRALDEGLGRPAKDADHGLTELHVLEHRYFDLDKQCRSETNYDATLRSVIDSVQQDIIAANEGLLNYRGE